MGPTWVLSAPGGPHVGLINLAVWGKANLGMLILFESFWESYSEYDLNTDYECNLLEMSGSVIYIPVTYTKNIWVVEVY